MLELLFILLLAGLIGALYWILFSPASQIGGKVVWKGHSDTKDVALTFDDGPNEPYTTQILDILQDYNIKATFFMVGENVLKHPDIVKRIAQEGHIVGNHTHSHSFLTPFQAQKIKKEIVKSQETITSVIGRSPALFRPPWLFRTPLLLNTTKELGLTTITGIFGSGWEVFKVSPKKIANDSLRHIQPGTILILHDGYNNKGTTRQETVDAVKIIVPALLKQGYTFRTVPELLSIPPYQAQRDQPLRLAELNQEKPLSISN